MSHFLRMRTPAKKMMELTRMTRLEIPNTNTSKNIKKLHLFSCNSVELHNRSVRTWRDVEHLCLLRFDFFIFSDVLFPIFWQILVSSTTKTNRSHPLVVPALQSPRLRSRMTSNLDDVTVARHPGAIWWRHVGTSAYCTKDGLIPSVVRVEIISFLPSTRSKKLTASTSDQSVSRTSTSLPADVSRCARRCDDVISTTFPVMTSRRRPRLRDASTLKLSMLTLRCCPGDDASTSDVSEGQVRAI